MREIEWWSVELGYIQENVGMGCCVFWNFARGLSISRRSLIRPFEMEEANDKPDKVAPKYR